MSTKNNDIYLENLAEIIQQEYQKEEPDYNLIEDVKEQMREMGCPLSETDEFEFLPTDKKEKRMNEIMRGIKENPNLENDILFVREQLKEDYDDEDTHSPQITGRGER